VGKSIAIEEGMELGDEDAEVRAFVNDGQDYGNVHAGSVSMMAGGKKRCPKMGTHSVKVVANADCTRRCPESGREVCRIRVVGVIAVA
jgi:hypothetical protein